MKYSSPDHGLYTQCRRRDKKIWSLLWKNSGSSDIRNKNRVHSDNRIRPLYKLFAEPGTGDTILCKVLYKP